MVKLVLKPRIQLVLIAALCIGFVGFALLLQHVRDVLPCPLCVLQRYALLAIAAFLPIVGAPGRLAAYRRRARGHFVTDRAWGWHRTSCGSGRIPAYCAASIRWKPSSTGCRLPTGCRSCCMQTAIAPTIPSACSGCRCRSGACCRFRYSPLRWCGWYCAAGMAVTLADIDAGISIGALQRLALLDPLEARILLSQVLGLSRVQLITAGPNVASRPMRRNGCGACLGRRIEGEPIAYLTGETRILRAGVSRHAGCADSASGNRTAG